MGPCTDSAVRHISYRAFVPKKLFPATEVEALLWFYSHWAEDTTEEVRFL